MKSVMIFDPKDSEEQRVTKFMDWRRDNNMNISIDEIKRKFKEKEGVF